jgi:phospholipid-binding lipoprotein MlaA
MVNMFYKKIRDSFKSTLLVVGCVVLLGGCATTNTGEDEASSRDPLESVNRGVFAFNEQVDMYFLKPVAEKYVEYTPEVARKGVHNFVTNLGEPKTAVNSLLQGNFKNFGNSTTRFLVNVAFGYGGFVDRASKEGVFATQEDFGQTLGVWGVPTGAYIVLPFLGASDVRDTTGKIIDTLALDPFGRVENNAGDKEYLFYVVRGVDIVDKRAEFLGTVDTLRDNAVDFYAKVRNIFWQKERQNSGDAAAAAADNANFDEFFSGNAQ